MKNKNFQVGKEKNDLSIFQSTEIIYLLSRSTFFF